MKSLDRLIKLFRETRQTTNKDLYRKSILQLVQYKSHVYEVNISYTGMGLGNTEIDKCIVLNLDVNPEATFKKSISGQHDDIAITIDRMDRDSYKVIIEYIKPKKKGKSRMAKRSSRAKVINIFSPTELKNYLS